MWENIIRYLSPEQQNNGHIRLESLGDDTFKITKKIDNKNIMDSSTTIGENGKVT